MIFIKLTLNDDREIWLNSESIIDITKQLNREGSFIVTGKKNTNNIVVKESPEEIISQIEEREEAASTLIEGVEVLGGEFEKELSFLINRTCKDNSLNTNDFILAKYLCDCLEAFKDAKERSEYLKKDKESSRMDWKQFGD